MVISEVALKSLVGTWVYSVRAPAAALVAAVAASLLGRARALRFLAPSAAGLGVLAGWIILAGLSFRFAGPLSRLPAVALLLIIGQAVLGTKPHPKLAPALAILISILCAWWLCGAPHSAIPPSRDIVKALAIAVWVFLLTWLSLGSDPWRLAAAAAALAVALHAVGAASAWPLAALVPAAAAIGSLPNARTTAPLLAASLSIAAASGAASLAIGRLPHAHVGPVGAACLAVPATLWLAGRIARKFRRPGGLHLALAAVLAFAAVSLVALSAAALTRLR